MGSEWLINRAYPFDLVLVTCPGTSGSRYLHGDHFRSRDCRAHEPLRTTGTTTRPEGDHRVADDGAGVVSRVFGVNLHDLDELGEGQEYQLFFKNVLSGTLSGDAELVVGLDLRKRDSFIMPVREGVQIYEDDTLHRQKRAGFYGWAEQGFAVLDNRRVILGSL